MIQLPSEKKSNNNNTVLLLVCLTQAKLVFRTTHFGVLIWLFPKCFHWNSVTKIFVITVKGAQTCHPAMSCVRDQDERHLRDKIFKLSPIHASMIYEILWICWIQWIPFRENSIITLIERRVEILMSEKIRSTNNYPILIETRLILLRYEKCCAKNYNVKKIEDRSAGFNSE